MNRNVNLYGKQEHDPYRYRVATHNHIIINNQQRYSTAVDRKMDISKEKQNDRILNINKKTKRQPLQQQPKRISGNYLTFKTMMVTPQTQAQTQNNLHKNQPIQEKKFKEKKDVKFQTRELERVNSAVSINSKKQITETKQTQPKFQSKQDQTKKNSEKRSNEVQKPRKLLEKEPSPNQFLCNEEMEVIQPKSSRLETKKSKPIIKTNIIKPKQGIEQQLMEFEQSQALINMEQQAQQVMYLGSRENAYAPDPNYIDRKQKNFKWNMRAILIEWMMHVSYEFRLKRDTFHLAVSLTDLYFSRTTNVPKTQLQLVGAAAMYLSAKIEEKQPLSVVKFAESTSGKYEPQLILEMQAKISHTMKWELNPPTIAMWSNKIMQQWDLFLEENDYARNHPLMKQSKSMFFKKPDQKAYGYFRQVVQILDCCLLEIQSLQYKQKPLVCSVLYLVLKRIVEGVHSKHIVEQYPRASSYLLDEENLLNDLFRAFVEYTFGFLLLDLLPTVQYCSTFFGLQLTYEAPDMSAEQLKQSNFEQYSSYQTYNNNSMSIIKRRPRGIIEGIYAH